MSELPLHAILVLIKVFRFISRCFVLVSIIFSLSVGTCVVSYIALNSRALLGTHYRGASLIRTPPPPQGPP